MLSINFHHETGPTDVVDVEPGITVMRAALVHGVDGIIGECGGQAMCATCHVLVREDFVDRLAPMDSDEDEMLECTATPREVGRSRLGCQITMTGELDGLHVDVPGSR